MLDQCLIHLDLNPSFQINRQVSKPNTPTQQLVKVSTFVIFELNNSSGNSFSLVFHLIKNKGKYIIKWLIPINKSSLKWKNLEVSIFRKKIFHLKVFNSAQTFINIFLIQRKLMLERQNVVTLYVLASNRVRLVIEVG